MSFDRLAPHYRWMEYVLAGSKLQRCRLAWLDQVKQCRRVLMVGEGPGRFLAASATALSEAQVVCVDASRQMLLQARAAWLAAGGDPDRVVFVEACLPDWEPQRDAFDLVVTHFFLDCFSSPLLERVVARIAAAAQPRARWLCADFRRPERGPARWRAEVVLALAYGFFRLATRLPASRLASPDPLLERHGFRLGKRQLSEWGLLHSDLWVRA